MTATDADPTRKGASRGTRLRTTVGPTMLVLAAVLLVACGEPRQTERAPEGASGLTAKPLVRARRAMVVAAHPLASEAGLSILKAGGSAADAAIATQLVLGLVEPQSSGLGGGAMLVNWSASTRDVTTYDGRETAPAAANENRFMRDGRPVPFDEAVRSGLSVGTPGTVRLLEHVHRKHGKLPWPRLFEPAIALATKGFAVSPRLHKLLAAEGAERFPPAARALYFDESGKPRPVGHRLSNPQYAATLSMLASGGAETFYTGQIAGEIVATVGAAPRPGDLSLADLAGYRVVERPPVCAPYRLLQVCGMGPPSSGGLTVGQTLMLLEGFDLGTRPGAAMNAQALHIAGEALRLAFADRNRYIADPDHVPQSARLLDPAYVTERRKLISPSASNPKPQAGLPPGTTALLHGIDETHEIAGTSHVSIIDEAGNAIALTTTIEAGFGSRLWAAGFFLNNQLTDFSFRARDASGRPIANRVGPGKRPRSSMSPTIVLDGSSAPLIVTGSPGGGRIIPYVVKSAIATIDWQLDPAAGAALPNFAARDDAFVLESPGATLREALANPRRWLGALDTMVRLKAVGQSTRLEIMTSGTHTIRRTGAGLEGGADPRREGLALGD
jgi:gamma-glutamyltranspeptidase/glutathione hydrolase